MKLLLLVGLLLTGLTGCSKNGSNPAPVVDPFLGHWEAELTVFTHTTSSGQVTTTGSTTDVSVLDVDATSLAISRKPKGQSPAPTKYFYVRSGELLFLTSTPGGTVSATVPIYARALTATSFTLESTTPDLVGGFDIQQITFHR